jgi:hypothetical protein
MNTALGSNQSRRWMIVVAALTTLVIAGTLIIKVNLPAIEPFSFATHSKSASDVEVQESGLMDGWLYAVQAEFLAEANELVDSWLYAVQAESTTDANELVDGWLYAVMQESQQHASNTYVLGDGWLYAAVEEAQD